VAVGEYDISIDKLVAAAEILPNDQKTVGFTTMLPEESKVPSLQEFYFSLNLDLSFFFVEEVQLKRTGPRNQKF